MRKIDSVNFCVCLNLQKLSYNDFRVNYQRSICSSRRKKNKKQVGDLFVFPLSTEQLVFSSSFVQSYIGDFEDLILLFLGLI